jgi:hypothetical protein
MINIGKGIIAGLVASATIAGAFVLAALTGITQASDPVQAATGIMMTPTGLSWVVPFAVVLHLLFGTVLGGMYGILLDRAERRASTRRAILMGW